MSQQENSAGRLIFLNGASCAGQTIIAHALQETMNEPYLHDVRLLGFNHCPAAAHRDPTLDAFG